MANRFPGSGLGGVIMFPGKGDEIHLELDDWLTELNWTVLYMILTKLM
jgi:hypothetical protein